MTSALHSEYIIDGITQGLTPAQILDRCMAVGQSEDYGLAFDPVADETLDPSPSAGQYDSWKVQDYMEEVMEAHPRGFSFPFSAQVTKLKIAHALTATLCSGGHFRLGNLALSLRWRWNFNDIGSHAAFYASVAAAGEYIDSLGLRVASYSLDEVSGAAPSESLCGLEVSIVVDSAPDDDFIDELFRVEDPVVEKTIYQLLISPDPDSWIVYVPMESSDYRLGGSLLSDVEGQSGTLAPDLTDPDYFIDVYEVVREMVEDRVPLSVQSVSSGGLMAALGEMTAETGARINIASLMKSTGEQDVVRTLFAEVPAVILQVRDEDFDYIDAEFTLQDVAFFPLGHPAPGRSGIKVETSDRGGLQNILESLIRSQSSEGED